MIIGSLFLVLSLVPVFDIDPVGACWVPSKRAQIECVPYNRQVCRDFNGRWSGPFTSCPSQ